MQPDDDDRIPLGRDPDDDRDLGPDERDRDLLDGSWEQKYYSGQLRTRDWNTVALGIAIIVVIALVLPMLLVALR
ncbi:hypothetical protein [Tepidiforma sp.]|uniref:hypothetical protein n=1 Tax=Tepidiforma sp. TaxID=2682230 RepID=UPI0021DE6637|nr:hypothetical protein [Tepidiforma sp.]MCX7616728.1 hypothetical protein [Tepidiforma sp.]GIW19546.1 MAG: hypothetical protein KatS3mg064_2703 [Tepidiforma sp.]